MIPGQGEENHFREDAEKVSTVPDPVPWMWIWRHLFWIISLKNSKC